jgi:1-acyl-sn-glycerol-3-phosphate acyltransferase
MKINLAMTIQNFGRAVLSSYFDIRVSGEIPKTEKPLVLVANHSGFMDGFMLFFATKRPIAVLTKIEVFNRFSRSLLESGGAIETDWKDADYWAIEKSRTKLQEGIDIGLFPEGTRCKGDYSWLKDGVIVLNAKQRADFIPVFIFGTRLTGKSKGWIPPYKSLIEVVVGEPVAAMDVYGSNFSDTNRKEISIAGERLRQRLQKQLLFIAQEVANPLPTDEVAQ